ncbi:MAG TPA: hypothetical protein ENL20_13025 [Candidatus Cloacimonetes bacterium]|nr:hypothetical protein [Candidatus Cloacimonadota bacterium]
MSNKNLMKTQLEFFDNEGITLRKDNLRIFKKSFLK